MTGARESLHASIVAVAGVRQPAHFPTDQATDRSSETSPGELEALLHDHAYLTAAGARTRARELDWLGAFVSVVEDSPETPGQHATPGFPIAVKDVIDVAGYPTLDGFRTDVPAAVADAPAWAALRAAGAELVGKTTTHALALGATTPGCLNPIDPTRIAGGSSGGSAAAVAAGIVPVAIGTDTGGSVRVPAALCGVLGLKPTVGAVSTVGVSPLAPSQDVVGVLSRTVEDLRMTFDVMRGRPTATSDRPLSVGFVDERWARASSDVLEPILQAAAQLASGGSELRPLHLPLSKLASAASYLIMLSEAAYSWPTQLFDAGQTPPDDVAELLRLGEGITAVEYINAKSLARRIRQELLRELSDAGAEVLMLPAVAIPAPVRGADTVEVDHRVVPVEAALGRFAALASASGLPAISVPAGLSPDGLPLGIQFIGAPHAEGRLLDAAALVAAGEGASEVRTALATAGVRNREANSRTPKNRQGI